MLADMHKPNVKATIWRMTLQEKKLMKNH